MGRIMKATFLMLAVIALAGCSTGNTASGTLQTSGHAISENSVSGSVISESAPDTDSQDREGEILLKQVGGRTANDNNKYAPNQDGDVLFQYDLKEKTIKTFPMNIASVEWVTNEWLYYRSDGTKLWRMPIEKSEKGDRLKLKNKERLLKGYDIYHIIYMTDSYLLMEMGTNQDNETLCKYDLKSGRLTELMGSKELGSFPKVYYDKQEDPIVLNGNLFIEGEKSLFCLDPESGESAVVNSVGRKGITCYEKSGSILYFVLDEELYQYESMSKKVSCLIPEERFIEGVDNLGLGLVSSVNIKNIYLEKGSMYFVLYVERMEEGRKELTYMKDELFSASEDHFSQLHHEDTLMDYLDQKGWYNKSTEDNDFIIYDNMSGISDIHDGIIYAWYRKKKDGGNQEVQYDIMTKRIKENI